MGHDDFDRHKVPIFQVISGRNPSLNWRWMPPQLWVSAPWAGNTLAYCLGQDDLWSRIRVYIIYIMYVMYIYIIMSIYYNVYRYNVYIYIGIYTCTWYVRIIPINRWYGAWWIVVLWGSSLGEEIRTAGIHQEGAGTPQSSRSWRAVGFWKVDVGVLYQVWTLVRTLFYCLNGINQVTIHNRNLL